MSTDSTLAFVENGTKLPNLSVSGCAVLVGTIEVNLTALPTASNIDLGSTNSTCSMINPQKVTINSPYARCSGVQGMLSTSRNRIIASVDLGACSEALSLINNSVSNILLMIGVSISFL